MKKYARTVLFLSLVFVAFFAGILYVVTDVYYQGKQIEKEIGKKSRLASYYRWIAISKYIKLFYDDYAMDSMIAVFPCIKELSVEERFYYYVKFLQDYEQYPFAYFAQDFSDAIEADKIELTKYIEKIKYTGEYKNLSKQEKDFIHAYLEFDDHSQNKVMRKK